MVRLLAAVLLAPALAAGIAAGAVHIAGHPPAYAGPEPKGIVWAERVFTGRPPLAAWLNHRRVSYATWSARHPRAAARLEHRGAHRGS